MISGLFRYSSGPIAPSLTITASSFVNEYHWGTLKGDLLEWVQQYFDAHVYSSNWGSCRLLLRLPHGTFDAATIRDYVKAGRERRYRFEKAFEAMDVDDWCLLDWSFNDDSGEHARFSEEMDGAGWMTRLLPVRDELLAGDARPLYLGWLARLGNDEIHDDEIEPPVPAGLQALTPAQVALAEFLMLDADWLAAAAEASPSLLAPESSRSKGSRFDSSLRELPFEEMRAKLRILLQGRSREAERTLRSASVKWRKGRNAKQLNCPGAVEYPKSNQGSPLIVPSVKAGSGKHASRPRPAVVRNAHGTSQYFSNRKTRRGQASMHNCDAQRAAPTIRHSRSCWISPKRMKTPGAM
ncbi:hypothetical protein HDG40_007829, partial [Paraburkholderia sp. JPY158]|nr:hypothetical protein [Paraburkholderia atlantica]